MRTRITRWRAPNRLMSATPGTEISSGSMRSSTTRDSSSIASVSLATASCITGSASASALTMVRFSSPVGRSRCTRATASRTSLAATTRSTLGLNSMMMRKLPSSLAERTRATPGTRAAAPSSKRVTSASSVSGAAPGKLARTATMGRSMLGSSRTSTPSQAVMPAITINRLITITSQGRRMASAGRSEARSSFMGVRRWE